jgi:opacity protein-like surface antigen
MTIVPVDMTILDINQSIDLSFEDTPSGSVAYVGIRAPQMYTYGLYFDNHVGANWSLDCRDVFTGFLPPTYAYTEDASSYTLVETRLEDAFVFSMPMMASTPTTSIIGNQYIEMYQCGGTGVNYVNGSAIMASMSSGAYQNIIDTFYIQIVGSSFGGVQTSEFNVTFHFEAYQIPVLPLVTTSFSVNQTIGPFYQAYALPVISGHEYDLSVWASDYNTSGVAGIFMAPVPQIYLDWQWAGMVPLYQTTPSGGMPMQVININETAGLRFIAVRTTTLYVGMVGTSMSGPPPSDTTEVTFNVTVSLPTPYALGSVVTESLDDMDWAIYSTTVTAGTSYRLSLSLDASGNYVLGSVFDGLGYTPFDAMMYTLWSEVYTDYLNSSITYQALTIGPVTIILIGDGDVSFSLVAVGEAPGSFVLGLIIGLIFMIAGVIIVYVVMRRRY